MELEELKQAATMAGDDDVLELIASHERLVSALEVALDDDSPLWAWVNEKGIGRTEYQRRTQRVELCQRAYSEATGAA
jgi:hypothetical protein